MPADEPDLRDEVEYLRQLVDRLIAELSRRIDSSPDIVRKISLPEPPTILRPPPWYSPWERPWHPWITWTSWTSTSSNTGGDFRVG